MQCNKNKQKFYLELMMIIAKNLNESQVKLYLLLVKKVEKVNICFIFPHNLPTLRLLEDFVSSNKKVKFRINNQPLARVGD